MTMMFFEEKKRIYFLSFRVLRLEPKMKLCRRSDGCGWFKVSLDLRPHAKFLLLTKSDYDNCIKYKRGNLSSSIPAEHDTINVCSPRAVVGR